MYGVNFELYEVVVLLILLGYYIVINIQGEIFLLYVYGKQKLNFGYGFVVVWYFGGIGRVIILYGLELMLYVVLFFLLMKLLLSFNCDIFLYMIVI